MLTAHLLLTEVSVASWIPGSPNWASSLATSPSMWPANCAISVDSISPRSLVYVTPMRTKLPNRSVDSTSVGRGDSGLC